MCCYYNPLQAIARIPIDAYSTTNLEQNGRTMEAKGY